MSAIDRERVQAALTTSRYGRSLTLLEQTGSTNDDAREALQHGAPSGLTIVADHQRSGRGSRGRVWQSPAGTDLYLSIVDRPALAPSVLPTMTLAIGLALADTIDAFVGAPERVAIKWPNDVWIDRKKCSGILVEALATGAQIDGVVIGVGLNVNRDAWPDELREIATSLRLAIGRPLDRGDVLATLLSNAERRVTQLVQHGSTSIVSDVNQRLAMRGEAVRCDDARGVLIGVAPSGALRLQSASGVIEVLAGTLMPDADAGL